MTVGKIFRPYKRHELDDISITINYFIILLLGKHKGVQRTENKWSTNVKEFIPLGVTDIAQLCSGDILICDYGYAILKVITFKYCTIKILKSRVSNRHQR